MGSSPAPFMADCSLFYYKEKWILKKKWKYLIQARTFSKTFRFINDIANIHEAYKMVSKIV